MTVYKWSIMGVFSSDSRTDPDVLAKAAPYVIPGEVSGSYGWPWRDTLDEALNDFATADWSATTWTGGVSYPNVVGGPLSIYLPDVSPSYTEYPYSVDIYNCSFTGFRGLDSPLSYTTLVVATGLSDVEAIPPNPPDPEDPEHIAEITIQLKRDKTLSKYSIKPSDASVLAKYGAPVKFIRASFDTTRTAVITETTQGGFMIYEEVANAPVAPIYIYSSKRKLLHIISADQIDQYKLYTF